MPVQPPGANTAPKPAPPSDWDRVAANQEFKDLMAAKARFIVPATLFFIVYYFTLPILVGYAPRFMSTPVAGVLNLAYLFALSQFFMAWTMAWLYMRAAARFDAMGKKILATLAVDKAAADKETAKEKERS
ncbi:MAG TPA: DUF485 domain-containing protein [Candidatus Acidoferrales bacterium]|jgi:uncharacterized membrane protein (DUF485 family)|nr:DUF485 domain-containing protein [Candidatus Acidoferrales bacterium]